VNKILGVKVDNLTKKEILEKVNSFLVSENPSTIDKVRGRFNHIATINPEVVLKAGEDEEYKNILNSCDLNVADGIGIWFAFLSYGKFLKCRMAGIDLMQEILKIADEKKLKIFLAANSRGLSSWEETRDAIHKIYPDMEIAGKNYDIKNYNNLQITNYEIVFCNFGMAYQEKFINSLNSLKSLKDSLPLHLCQNSNLEQNNVESKSNLLKNFNLPQQRCGGKIRLGMGVGGSFDYLTSKVPRAPKIMRQAGLEWLFRLFVQPNRWKRIWNAVVIFPIKIIFK